LEKDVIRRTDRQNWSTGANCARDEETKKERKTKTSRLVFTARLCPQLGMPPNFDRCTPPRRRFNQNIPRSVVLLEPCHCRNRHRGKLQNLSRPSVLFESSRFFYSARNGTQCLHCKRCISYSNSVRLSVHPSYAGIVSKRRHVARCSLHCWIAKCV